MKTLSYYYIRIYVSHDVDTQKHKKLFNDTPHIPTPHGMTKDTKKFVARYYR